MTSIRDQGIVLRRLDFSESSQVLVLLTRDHGKVRVIAKGIKRSTKTRFGTAIDLLDVGQVVLSVRAPRQEALATLTEWDQSRSLLGLRQKLVRMHAAQYAAEVTAALTEDWDPHPRAFDALARLLAELCEADRPLPGVVAFTLELLDEIGSAPQLEHCVCCRRDLGGQEPVYFSSLEGGLVCRDCEGALAEKRQVPAAIVPVLSGVQGAGTEVCGPVFELLNYHLAHLMGRRPQLAEALLSSAR